MLELTDEEKQIARDALEGGLEGIKRFWETATKDEREMVLLSMAAAINVRRKEKARLRDAVKLVK